MTARSIPGTQAQNVIFVALDEQLLPPARTLGLALAFAVDVLFGVELPLLPQPASTETAATAATQAAVRAARAAGFLRVCLRVSVNICGDSSSRRAGVVVATGWSSPPR
ncbi:MAG TPA: hypothetical protein VMC03_21630 [Streptosporangiaceae bacterium]|nr:hypothetical protein [Streptosporangiaceae bacterium]